MEKTLAVRAVLASIVRAHVAKEEAMAVDRATAAASAAAGAVEEEEDLCPICCAAPPAAKFVPCGHRSCLRCIRRHVQNDSQCFFCKTPLTGIVDQATGHVEPVVGVPPSKKR